MPTNQKDIGRISEIHEIMQVIRGSNATRDGDFRNTHFATILEYLYKQKSEDKATTLQKLALMVGMAQRQVRENYLDGLIAFGVISLTPDCKKWFWVGIKAIMGATGELKANTPEDNQFIANQLSKRDE